MCRYLTHRSMQHHSRQNVTSRMVSITNASLIAQHISSSYCADICAQTASGDLNMAFFLVTFRLAGRLDLVARLALALMLSIDTGVTNPQD